MPLVSVQVDFSAAEAMLGRLAASLASGFDQTVRRIAQSGAASIDATILSGGRPDPFAPLRPSTLSWREWRVKHGEQPVAGIDTPLRWDDTLRHAATASAPSVRGSDFTIDAWGFTNALTLPQAALLDQGGDIFSRAGNEIEVAARPFFHFQETDVDDFTSRVFADVHDRCQRAMQGKL